MRNRPAGAFLLFLAAAALSGCSTIPAGPSVMVLPSPGKSFEAFQLDDAVCRQWASRQVGGTPDEAMSQNLAGGAAIGTLLGAGLGAAIGSTSGDAGAGAAIGAGTGLLFGAAAASGPAYGAAQSIQRRYDIAYEQCMYARGNQIPGVVRTPRRNYEPPPPPPPGFIKPGPAVPYPPPPPP